MSLGAAIAYKDLCRDGTTTASNVYASMVANSPASNLFTPQLSSPYALTKPASAAIGGFDITRQFASPGRVDLISLLDVRITGSTSYFITLSIDGAMVWTGELDADLYPADEFISHLHVLLPTPVENAEEIKLEFGNSSVIEGRTVSIGRLWAGPVYRPPNGICKEWESTLIDPGEVGKSRGGQGYPRYRQKYRRVRMDLSHITFEQGFGGPSYTDMDLQQLGFRLGTTEPCLVFPRTTDATGAADTQAIHRIGIYGHLTELPNIRHRAGNHFDASLMAEELL